MSERLRAIASRPVFILAAGIALLLLINAWFWWTHRRGFTVFVDEAGYGGFSLDFTHALRNHGLQGLWDAYRDQRFYAPLVPLVGVPFHLFAGDSLTGTYAVVFLATPLLAVSTYLVTVRFAPRQWAMGAALVSVCAPDVLVWSRSVLFAVPAAAFFVAAIACLLRSRGFLDVRWSAAGGALLGLALLSRTMMLGLAPAPIVAMAVHAVAVGGQTRRRVVGGLVAVVTGVAVAATWYTKQLSEVVSYLRENPFHPHGYRPGRPPLRDVGQLLSALQLPLTLALVGGIVAVVVHEIRRRRVSGADRAPASPRWVERVRALLSHEWAVVALCLAQGVVVLRIARDATGQWVPLLPLLLALAVTAFARLPTRAGRAVAIALIAASIFNVAAQSDVIDGLGDNRTVDVALIGPVQLVEGRQFVERQLDLNGWPTGPAGDLPDVYRDWVAFNDRVVRDVVAHAAEHATVPVLFLAGGAQDPLNTNTLLLADRIAGSANSLLVGELPVSDASETERGINDPAKGFPRYVLVPDRDKTLDGVRGDPTPRHVAHQLRDAGFTIVEEFDAPDGRTFALWWLLR